jgi:two-component system, NarL family, nitrate/nitrite response regulator NarL
MMAEPLQVVVADDHPLFREGVIASLMADEGILVVGEAGEADGAVRAVRETLPDVVLLDVDMPGNGLLAASRITSISPATRVIMLTVSEDEDHLLSAMKAGASGYVLKGVSASELIRIVRSVSAGDVYVAPALAFGLLHEMTRPQPNDPLEELGAREREVLELVASGLSNQEIGLRMGLAERTVKHYMTNVLKKLQVRSRVEAALLAARGGLGQDALAHSPDAAVQHDQLRSSEDGGVAARIIRIGNQVGQSAFFDPG